MYGSVTPRGIAIYRDMAFENRLFSSSHLSRGIAIYRAIVV